MAMSDIDRERQRKEAADSITSRPPGASSGRIEAAMRRYLGASMFEALKRRKDETGPSDEHPKESPRGGRP
jgi:hypothetical protein